MSVETETGPLSHYHSSRLTIGAMTGQLSPGIRAAALTLLVGMTCMLLAPYAQWLQKWPAALTVPAAEWVGALVTELAVFVKPLARWGTWLLSHPMDWARFVLIVLPYPLIIAIFVALGWHLGGLSLASGVLTGMGFILFSGYWVPGMTTLSLVLVSVPLAMFAGLVLGIAAYKIPPLRRSLQTLLDIMQTVPTFAYLTPLLLLLGFGPVVGLVASAIYAAPPMARNVLLGLERVDPEIREAGIMNGANRWQQLFLVELPAASPQILAGVNQCIMAALSMVIIAAVIGGFDDIGWAVLLTLRKADFGNSLIAGLVIVIFAIIIDRLSCKLAEQRPRRSVRVGLAMVGLGAALALLAGRQLPAASEINILAPVADATNAALMHFTAGYGPILSGIKNSAMIYGLLPLRIRLDHAAVPALWGFSWSQEATMLLFLAASAFSALLALRGHLSAGLMLVIAVFVLKTGIAHLPWPFVLVAAGSLGCVASGWKLALFSTGLLGVILLVGLWEPAMLSLYLSGTAVMICAVVGGLIGLASAMSPAIWRVVRPVCDLLQTVPLFVFLIPVLMLFQIGEFSALLAIYAYAVVPMIRYTQQGLTAVPDELIEAAVSSGATKWAIVTEVRAPYAAPTILLGLNQTVLYAFSMLVIAALVGTTDLGQQIYLALGQGDTGLGLVAGAAMAILALIADRLIQAFAAERRAALGL